MIEEQTAPPATFRDKYEGWLKIKTSCSCCKTCSVYLEGPLRGKCNYGGPFQGYVKEESKVLEVSPVS